jgi:hypothetical protein
MSLEHLYYSILVDRPIQDQMVLLGCHQNCTVVMRMRYLLYFVNLHVQFAVALGIACQEDIEGL